MPANVDGMVREGVSAYRAGRKEEARTLLMRAVEIDQYNEQAWLWLSAVVESVDEQRTCLENVITINPNNERAKQGLSVLEQKTGASSKSGSTQADDVLAGTSFTSAPGANPFSATIDEELPSSIEWEAPADSLPTSSSSSSNRVKEPSPAEYDDWVSNLKLGGAGNNTNILPDDAARLLAMSDEDIDEEEDALFGVNKSLGLEDGDDADDLFASGPFGAQPAPPPVTQSDRGTRTPAPASKSSASLSSARNDALLDSIETGDDTLGSAFVDDFDEAEMDKPDASEFFRYIPREIVATRLPGTRERYPILAILGLLVFIALNVGAVALFVQKMLSS